MNYGNSACPACQKTTSGDCGRHDPFAGQGFTDAITHLLRLVIAVRALVTTYENAPPYERTEEENDLVDALADVEADGAKGLHG